MFLRKNSGSKIEINTEIQNRSTNYHSDAHTENVPLRLALTKICTVPHVNIKAVKIIGVINDVYCVALTEHFGIIRLRKSVFAAVKENSLVLHSPFHNKSYHRSNTKNQ